MIALLKTIIAILLGFGIWYLIGWFLSNEMNPLLWSLNGKLAYLLVGFISSDGVLNELSEY